MKAVILAGGLGTRISEEVVGISLPPATTPSLAGLAGIDGLIDSRIRRHSRR